MGSLYMHGALECNGSYTLNTDYNGWTGTSGHEMLIEHCLRV
jgi:hypothetical protein